MAGAGAGFTASTGFWELVNNVSALTGLAFFTLAVTFVLRVVTADARPGPQHPDGTAAK